MKVFSIKNLIMRISKTQIQSKEAIGDRISGIQERIKGVYTKISEMERFSSRLIRNDYNNINQSGSREISNPAEKQKAAQAIENNSTLDKKLGKVLLDKLFRGNQASIRDNILSKLSNSILPQLMESRENKNNVFQGPDLESQNIYLRNKNSKDETRGKVINTLDSDKKNE